MFESKAKKKVLDWKCKYENDLYYARFLLYAGKNCYTFSTTSSKPKETVLSWGKQNFPENPTVNFTFGLITQSTVTWPLLSLKKSLKSNISLYSLYGRMKS